MLHIIIFLEHQDSILQRKGYLAYLYNLSVLQCHFQFMSVHSSVLHYAHHRLVWISRLKVSNHCQSTPADMSRNVSSRFKFFAVHMRLIDSAISHDTYLTA